MPPSSKESVATSLILKFLERSGVQITQFVVAIVIARILGPSEYGMIALLTIITSLAAVFIQSGLGTALIQKKDADDLDVSSVFIYSILMSFAVYLFLYITAPMISEFYAIEKLTNLLRVLALILIPGAINSIQLAILSKAMLFKPQLFASIAAVMISGIAGLVAAYNLLGAWALVIQQLLYQVIVCIVLIFFLPWKLSLRFSVSRTNSLLRYGIKLLTARILDTLYHNLENLIIGKVYSANVLASCNKGKMFPLTLVDNIDGAVQSVLLPAYSERQNDSYALKSMIRRSISMSTYLTFTSMGTLAAIGNALILTTLGDKWSESIIYLQLFCAICMLFPLQTANLQAINAIGRSDIYLRLLIWKRAFGTVILFAAVYFFNTPVAVIISALLGEIFAVLINIPTNKNFLNYTIGEMIEDVGQNLIIAAILGGCLFLLNYAVDLRPPSLLALQCFFAIILFILLSYVFKNKNFEYIVSLVLNKLNTKD